MPGLKVTPDQLSTLGGAVARVSADVRGSHHGLKGQLAPLFGADWSGAAAAQFTALYEQFDQHAKEYVTDNTTPLINSWSDCNVGHTFAIPGLGLFVPVASPNAQLSANNLCGESPCTDWKYTDT